MVINVLVDMLKLAKLH